MNVCINCDHPKLCHDIRLKICYRANPRCQCVQYTDWPQPEVNHKAETISFPIPIDTANIQEDMTRAMMDLVSRLNNKSNLTE